jgi:2'-5' RNA ligase
MRLFIAIDIPKEIKLKISNSFLFTRDSLEFAQFTEIDNLHITLVFLGEIDALLLNSIKEAMGSVSRLYNSGLIKFSNAVIGPDKNSLRMLWLKLGDDSQKYLGSISRELKRELKNKNIPFDDSHENFNGHITLAKFEQKWQSRHAEKNEKAKAEDVEFIEKSLPEEFEASFDSRSMALFSSTEIDGRRLYVPLFESNFKE